MWFDLVNVEGSYFPHLAADKRIKHLVDLRFDHNHERVNALLEALCGILHETESAEDRWLFSSLGPLKRRMNLSVCDFLDENEFRVAFRLEESLKEHEEDGIQFSEIAFVCPVELLRTLLNESRLGFNFNLRFAGWLVSKARILEMMERRKVVQGLFALPEAGTKLAFCSSEDWDCIQFVSTDELQLGRLVARGGNA